MLACDYPPCYVSSLLDASHDSVCDCFESPHCSIQDFASSPCTCSVLPGLACFSFVSDALASLVVAVAFVSHVRLVSIGLGKSTMAEDLDQDLPDFDGDAEIEACGDQLGNLDLQTPADGQIVQGPTHIEEIPSDEEGIPTVWVDKPCKAEEDPKSIEKKEEPADGRQSDNTETKDEEKVPVQTKQELPPVQEPVTATATAQPPTVAVPMEQVGAEADIDMVPETTPLAAPLERASTEADTALTSVAEHSAATEPSPPAASAAETEARRRYEINGRVHLGMALEGVIRDAACMKEVLNAAAEQVGRVNAETSLAKSNLREHLRTGADQAWIAVWHVLFVAKGVQTQSIKALVEVHKPGSRWSFWHLNEAIFNVLHTMQSALSSLTDTWQVVSTLVSKTKAKQ
eukprot:1971691-Amphidinium_carterae.1